ncbi:MAG: RsmF rRNA methyltransferase first C-terminal domain-containing protein [Lachnospiraceae bacterium]|nr:RsmF rRNA methyltransferase first C-terminal domain-containing protein [Lachnospiraceae bacterium]
MLPEAFTNRMKIMLKDEYELFLKSYEAPRFHALRINTLKADFHSLPENFRDALNPVPWCETGYYYPETFTPGKHPYHEAGVYYIQEPSAMAPAIYLDARPGERILDLCAAPGGKSTQIAASMKGEGLLISNEIIPSRAKILSENIERMGIKNAVVTNESPQKLCKSFPEYFDKIMVDAPCSGEGMFRKNPDACEEWSPENVSLCASRQAEILDCAASMLKPGGLMVYSTCTFSPEENEGSIAHFLLSHKDFRIVKPVKTEGMSDGNPEFAKSVLSDEDKASPQANAVLEDLVHTIRLWPHKLNGEGHFIAVLKKDLPEGMSDEIDFKHRKEFPTIKGVSEKTLKDYQEFYKNNLYEKPEGVSILFGSQLYLVPDICPPLDKIKVLRAGLHLGTFLKNRFEPSHSLALSLTPNEVAHVMSLDMEHDDILKYLNGETLSHPGEKGWYLITIDGYSTGFGKLASGTMKNHYPKGLRKNLTSSLIPKDK